MNDKRNSNEHRSFINLRDPEQKDNDVNTKNNNYNSDNSKDSPQKKGIINVKKINDGNSPSQISGSSTIMSNNNKINKPKNGQGKVIFPDQSVYEGNFKDSEFDGYGEYKSKNYIYIGNYSCGKRNGKGKLTDLSNNIYYEGDFKNDMKDGRGIETYADKSRYIGEFKENMKDGYGELIIIFEDGKQNEYKGEFKEDLICGRGRYKYYYDNKEYIGEWENSEINGYGIMIDENVRHIGYYEHNKKHGYGATFHTEQNISILGRWYEDNEEGFGIILNLPNSDKIENISDSNFSDNESYRIIKIVYFSHGEIDNSKNTESEINKFMNNKEYEQLLQLYKEKFYIHYIQSFNEDFLLNNNF